MVERSPEKAGVGGSTGPTPGTAASSSRRARRPADDLGQRRVVEDHVRGPRLGLRRLEPPALERLVERDRPARRASAAGSRRSSSARKRLGLPGPRDGQVALRTRQADVEQAPLLVEGRSRLRELRRQLALLEPREEDGLELEALGAVVGQEVDAAPRVAAEALLEGRDELVDRAPSNSSASLTSRARSFWRVTSRSPRRSGITSSRPCSRAIRRASDERPPAQRLQQLPRAVA